MKCACCVQDVEPNLEAAAEPTCPNCGEASWIEDAAPESQPAPKRGKTKAAKAADQEGT
jgi:hypothetical protein